MRPAATLLAPFSLACLVAAAPYALPPERETTLPAGPGAELVQAQCAACHSLDLVTTQPPAMGEAFWRKTVGKMVETYGADIPEDQQAAIIAYLAQTPIKAR